MRVLVGGVGYRWMRDGSFGLVASDAMAAMEWPEGVKVDDLGFGAIYVAEDLRLADPPYDRLVLLAGVERGREPGQLYLTRYRPETRPTAEVQARVFEAGAGVIDVDHLLVIAHHFDALPPEVVVIELEPVDTSGGVELSPRGQSRLEEAIGLARSEALAPLRSTAPTA